MKRILCLFILLSIISVSAMYKPPMPWTNVKYSTLDEDNHSKKSKMRTCLKVAVPIAFYAASLGIVGYAAYYAGSELKESCNECSEKLKAAEDLFSAAQNCTDLIKYAVNYCPNAVQTCMNAFGQCRNGGNN